ncbi:phage exclusion protein Lit family protein [Streptomyces gilvus]|uniref:phage exclusion protein Lit family protein n=1 Tax=Streptomyces gilvus TaxID=2920937 RepID=UPI001F0F161C|nr:phage exclusion protein Lit family protein [Streptomyces sp. CME 23]MCH5676707.1 hypothetical protein [Streptomyces sp. CME 23]
MAGDASESMAKARRRVLASDRVGQLRETRRRAEKLGAHSLVQEVDELLRLAVKGEDPLALALEHILRAVLDAAAETARCPDGVSIEVGTLGYDLKSALLAKTLPFDDGSRLILVSDALGSMCDMLARIWALNLSPRQSRVAPFGYLGLTAERRAREPWQDPTIQSSVALLRWHGLHQRYHSVPAKLRVLLEERYRRLVDRFNLVSGAFIVAHEVGHILLGHPLGPSDAAGTRSVRFGPEMEHEADDFAMAVLDRMVRDTMQAGRTGALIALLALESEESFSFIRPQKTHPPVTERIERTLAGMGGFQRSGLAALARPLVRACGGASDVRRPIPDEWWDGLMANSRVSKETHGPSHFEIISFKDGLAGVKPDRWMELIGDSVAKKGQPDVRQGLRAIFAGQVRSGLAQWGVPPAVADAVDDPERSFTAYWLLTRIQEEATVLAGAETTYRFAVSAAAVNAIDLHIRQERQERQ